MNQHIIEQYLNGTLNADELHRFESQLAADETLAEAVFLQKLLQQTAQQYSQVGQVVQTLTNLSKQRMDAAGNFYTLDELLGMFSLSAYYEEELALTRSGSTSSILLTKPQPDADCFQTLEIEFAAALPKPASIWVENNLEETVIAEQNMPPASTEFTLDITPLKPGRYYLKVSIDDDTLIRGFYVQKNLMPTM